MQKTIFIIFFVSGLLFFISSSANDSRNTICFQSNDLHICTNLIEVIPEGALYRVP